MEHAEVKKEIENILERIEKLNDYMYLNACNRMQLDLYDAKSKLIVILWEISRFKNKDL